MTENSAYVFGENGEWPIYGYRCCDECLAFMGYGHHVDCERVEMVPAERSPERASTASEGEAG